MPDGGHSVTNKGYRGLLGGSSKHAVRTASTFDIGLLRNMLLLPDDVRIGYNIISAGQLHSLRTVQDTDGNFYVLNCVGDVISGGFIGQDNLFYLQDLNLLKPPGEILPSRRLQISVTTVGKTRKRYSKKRLRSRRVVRNKINVITRKGNGIEFKGVKRSDTTNSSDAAILHPNKQSKEQPTRRAVSFDETKIDNTNGYSW
jgi:hypothetical protein